MIEAKFIPGGLEAFFFAPPCTLDLDQRIDRRIPGTPCGEIRVLAVGKAAPVRRGAISSSPTPWTQSAATHANGTSAAIALATISTAMLGLYARHH